MPSLSQFINTTSRVSTPSLSSISTSGSTSSTLSMIEFTFRSSFLFVYWQILKMTSFFPNLNLSWPYSIFASADLVAKKGHPKIIGTSKSTLQSRIIESTGNMNFYTLTRVSYSIPIRFFTVFSAMNNCLLVGVGAPNLGILNTARGFRFMLDLDHKIHW